MSTPTMEQRLDDFHTMLKRAGLVRATVGQCWTTEEDVPGKPLAALARDTAELCAAWVDAAQRAKEGHPPSDQAVNRAVLVATRCLGILADTVDLDTAQLTMEVSNTATCHIGALTLGEDLALTQVDRMSRLLAGLGDVACYYDYPADDETAWRVLVEVTELLAARAICAAVAANNGRWEAES